MKLIFVAERLALRWIQKYIGQFGGDRTKVTMYVCFCYFKYPPLYYHILWSQVGVRALALFPLDFKW